MKKTTRLIAIVLALALLCVTAAACGSTEPEPTEPSDTAPDTIETTEATEPPTEAPTWPTYPDSRKISAKQAFVYDCATEEFLYISGSASETVYLASITKLFTAHVALQYLEPTTQITVGDELDLVSWGSSVAGLEKGDVLTVEMLIEGMMLPSGNDAAYVLAVAAGRAIDRHNAPDADSAVYSEPDVDSALNVFMAHMNQEARLQGMLNTHFVNPDGIHESDHYSSMGDLAILGKLALDWPAIVRSCSIARDMVSPVSGRSYAWKNTNALVDPASEYYCPVCLGLKTGQTPNAGSCLLSAFDLDGRKIVIGVFGCEETDDRFPDTLQLLQMYANP